MTPLFVLGMGRSGTTNALRVLNTHPEIMLDGEISLSILSKLMALLEAADRSFEKNEARNDGWLARKSEYIYSSFGHLAKAGPGRPRKRSRARFLGHKSPQLENLFDQYEAQFATVGAAPRYVYCARNAFDCWTSYKTMPWNPYKSVGAFLNHYAASYAALDRMLERAPGRVSVMNLDALIASRDPIAFYRATLFEPLGLNLPARSIEAIADIHSAKERTSAARDLDAAERAAIENHPAVRERHAAMFAPHLRRETA
ncbi:MAG: sulfotransferase [Alphaproteobacteria bacterium]|nr:sulfotransferase [Alphaproteobacteria bacterium]